MGLNVALSFDNSEVAPVESPSSSLSSPQQSLARTLVVNKPYSSEHLAPPKNREFPCRTDTSGTQCLRYWRIANCCTNPGLNIK